MEKIIVTKSNVTVYKNWRENICCEDKNNKALTEKAGLKRERYPRGEAKGCSRFGSRSSEDALSWSVFRTLQLRNSMNLFYELGGIKDSLQTTIFWTRDTKTGNCDKDLVRIINLIEPKSLWRIQQTEPDVILKGKSTLVFIEAKLGKQGAKISAWARKKDFERKGKQFRYQDKGFLDGLFTQDFIDDFGREGKRFYQLVRNYVIGNKLAEAWKLDFQLCALVNRLNRAKNGNSHEQEFGKFKGYLLDKDKAHILTWQDMFGLIDKDERLIELAEWMRNYPYLDLLTESHTFE